MAMNPVRTTRKSPVHPDRRIKWRLDQNQWQQSELTCDHGFRGWRSSLCEKISRMMMINHLELMIWRLNRDCITPVKKTETMEKQRSHPFVCIPMFKQVEHAQRQGLQIEVLQREVESPFSPEVVLGKEACPKIDPETALNKFHCAHKPFEHRYPEIRCTKKHKKCFKSWKFKFKRRNMGKERQKKHVQYTASQEEHRECWLQRRKEKQFLKSCRWKYKG
ncbi:unnamed protein product [Brassica rapa]|uniref:Uncharacterized protein n=1 Tax=Brassica campestris TaxID=3711 RepID=A0A8D9M438_BRACM|nr:unnamed protein product [Brassica rapa]